MHMINYNDKISNKFAYSDLLDLPAVVDLERQISFRRVLNPPLFYFTLKTAKKSQAVYK